MFKGILPREGKFFDLFKQSGEKIAQSSQALKAMFADMAHAESHARTVKHIENECDEITHKTIDLLHKTFITPLDREDIHQLITKMDDIVDFIDATAQRVVLYGIKKIPGEAIELTDICIQSGATIQRAVGHLEDMKNPEEILKICVEINRLENEADHVMRAAMAKLFREEPDTRELIKVKEIYELLETVTDRCEDVANIIEGIVLEYA